MGARHPVFVPHGSATQWRMIVSDGTAVLHAPGPPLATQGDPLELRADLDPVLLDMRNSGVIVPDVLAEAHEWA